MQEFRRFLREHWGWLALIALAYLLGRNHVYEEFSRRPPVAALVPTLAAPSPVPTWTQPAETKAAPSYFQPDQDFQVQATASAQYHATEEAIRDVALATEEALERLIESAVATHEAEVLQEAYVSRVIDGDSIEVIWQGETHEVRYIGLDAPEWNASGGAEATAANRSYVEGRYVRLVPDVSETDKYGRLLRYVYVESPAFSLFVNAALIQEGYATVLAIEPDTTYAYVFEELESEARSRGVGIWGPARSKVPVPTFDGPPPIPELSPAPVLAESTRRAGN